MGSDVQATYQAALERVVEKARGDNCILAAVLLGSLAYDTVWERSDIDLLLVTQEMRLGREGLCMEEAGVVIHAMLVTRSGFRRILERPLQGSFMHSLLGKGRMLFCKDPPLQELFEARHRLGDRDRALQLLQVASGLLPALTKAQKWLYARRNLDYCSYWILKCADSVASLVLLLNGEVPSREAVLRAVELDPALMRAVYTDRLNERPTEERLRSALESIDVFLRANVRQFFGPVFDYLREEQALRSMTEINHHFKSHAQLESVDSACEWLADEGYLQELAISARLTEKSHTDVEEAAYYLPDEESG